MRCVQGQGNSKISKRYACNCTLLHITKKNGITCLRVKIHFMVHESVQPKGSILKTVAECMWLYIHLLQAKAGLRCCQEAHQCAFLQAWPVPSGVGWRRKRRRWCQSGGRRHEKWTCQPSTRHGHRHSGDQTLLVRGIPWNVLLGGKNLAI